MDEGFDMEAYLRDVIDPLSEQEWLSVLYSHVAGASDRQLRTALLMIQRKMGTNERRRK